MALAATTFWEVQTGGSDTANGGAFDPSNANMATNLAATSATGNAPVVTSASYNFAARDVGHWLFVKSGTNWYPGWYPISSVAANAATLNATTGAWIDGNTRQPSTKAGCASTASPTSGTWSVDYSQTATPGISYTDMVIDGTTNTKYTSAANPVGPNVVGNVISVTSGTGFTVQWVQVSSVSGTTATCDKSLGTLSSTGGNGGLGGALLSVGNAGLLHVAGNQIYVKSGSYSISSASNNVAGGCCSLTAGATANYTRLIGYGSLRGDFGTKPVLTAGTISTFAVVTLTNTTELQNVSIDCAAKTASKGVQMGNANVARAYRVKVANATTGGFYQGGAAVFCEATGCTNSPFYVNSAWGCVAHDNTCPGFTAYGTGDYVNCIAANNTGASSDGFSPAGQICHFFNCLAYKNGRHGFTNQNASTFEGNAFVNCLATDNAGYGWTQNAICDDWLLINCAAYNNTSGDYDTTKVQQGNVFGFIGNALFTGGTPFTNAAGNDFSFNATAGAGALLRATGFPAVTWPGLSTLSYRDIGPSQHQDSASSGGITAPTRVMGAQGVWIG